jgi:hypothetical protein
MDFLPFVAFGSGVGFEHAESIFKESGLSKSLSFEPAADERVQSLVLGSTYLQALNISASFRVLRHWLPSGFNRS